MERYPLSKTEYGIYVEQMTARNTAYNNPFTVDLPDDVDIERLRAAVRTVVAAHPYLKTGFGVDENGDVYKFTFNCGAETEVEVIHTDRFDVREYVRPFDLGSELLFRFFIIITPERKLLFSDVHHIIYDGASFGVLARQINDAYNGLPVEKESFTANDVAMEEQARLASDEYVKAREYYLDLFDGVDTDTELFCQFLLILYHGAEM
ncbi:MAG: hypothetical protein J6P98_09020 [Clostridia bacterium]|nr:hypothetical protein [Clostridia bacterium]